MSKVGSKHDSDSEEKKVLGTDNPTSLGDGVSRKEVGLPTRPVRPFAQAKKTIDNVPIVVLENVFKYSGAKGMMSFLASATEYVQVGQTISIDLSTIPLTVEQIDKYFPEPRKVHITGLCVDVANGTENLDTIVRLFPSLLVLVFHAHPHTKWMDPKHLNSCSKLLSLAMGEGVLVNSINFVTKCPNLQNFTLSHCDKLGDIQPLASCQHLRTLTLGRTMDIDLSLLGTLPQLETLSLSESNMTTLAQLNNCVGLISLEITTSFNLHDITAIANFPKLQHLNFVYCSKIKDIAVLSHCPDLRRLSITSHGSTDLTGLKNCAKLEVLELTSWGKLVDMTALVHLKKLEEISLNRCDKLTSIAGVQNCTNLKKFQLFPATNISSVTELAACTQLEELVLHQCGAVKNLEFLQHCTKLRSINLADSTNLVTLAGVDRCPVLDMVDLTGCVNLTDIANLEKCQVLSNVILMGCNNLRNFDTLGKCTNLQSIYLQGCQIASIAILTTCLKLEVLNIVGCNLITDLAPLKECVHLRTLIVSVKGRYRGLSQLKGVKIERG